MGRYRISKSLKIALICLIVVAVISSIPVVTPALANTPLDVPFKPQVPPGTVQNGTWPITKNCGQTSSLMVFGYHKRTVPTELDIWQINNWLSTRYSIPEYMTATGDGWYTNVEKLATLAKEFGGFQESSVHHSTNGKLDQLEEELKNGFPVIIAVYIKMNPQKDEHFMVLNGISGDDYVIVNDPGRSDGEDFNYAMADFKKCWAKQNYAYVTVHPPGTDKTSWEFQNNGNTEGYMVYNVEYGYKNGKPDLGFSVVGGIFYINPAVQDPYIMSPFLSIDSNIYKTVEICMASNAPDGTGAVYFTTSESQEWSEDKKGDFTVTNDGKYYTYSVIMNGNPKWTGTITAIRIDPANSGIPNSDEDTIGFDRIALLPLQTFPTIDIITPTKSSPASAGAYENPNHIDVTVEIKKGTAPITGLTNADFTFKIGGKVAASSLIDDSTPGQYKFDLTPPTQDDAGKYDLEAILVYKGDTLKDKEEEAVIYTAAGHADVMLIIDRSGSMGWPSSKIRRCQDFSKALC